MANCMAAISIRRGGALENAAAVFDWVLSRVMIICTSVSVAQLVEHRSVAPNVVGSNPIAHPT